MKKIVIALGALVLSMSMLVGCSDIYMVFHRPTSLPNFYGKPTNL